MANASGYKITKKVGFGGFKKKKTPKPYVPGAIEKRTPSGRALRYGYGPATETAIYFHSTKGWRRRRFFL